MLGRPQGRCWKSLIHRAAVLMLALLACGVWTQAQVSVTTYHYDNFRTGWNSKETVLTTKAVAGSSFGVLSKIALDDFVEAQPLVVTGVNIASGKYPGIHDVVYIATNNNSIYAIDTSSGVVLLKVNLGPPVVQPLGCSGSNPDVGINSTPVIDLSSNTLYAISYTQNPRGPAYNIHALDLGTLAHKGPPQLVTASHLLGDGSSFEFSATYQRQRPALLLANGNIYAGFGSFCDLQPSHSRGWLMGWQAGSLTPLAENLLFDTQPTAPDNFFLSSIWMSGYGLAADDLGNVLFVTGNSDANTYDGSTNLQESVVKVSPDISKVVDFFTPSDVDHLDDNDVDFGSGGVMVLPDQPGRTPHLAVAAGKDGNLYFMNEDELGRYSQDANNVLGTYPIGLCWCGPSYFVDPTDGVARVVTSGGSAVKVWKLQTSPAPSLVEVTASQGMNTRGNGFFTTVSSNGTAHPIIWALSRPPGSQTAIYLYAFAPDQGGTKMKQLFAGNAGTWAPNGTNPNLVPVVANGKVFVASNKQLVVLGLH
jgi:outer membrane protein assembly factor BamB